MRSGSGSYANRRLTTDMKTTVEQNKKLLREWLVKHPPEAAGARRGSFGKCTFYFLHPRDVFLGFQRFTVRIGSVDLRKPIFNERGKLRVRLLKIPKILRQQLT